MNKLTAIHLKLVCLFICLFHDIPHIYLDKMIMVEPQSANQIFISPTEQRGNWLAGLLIICQGKIFYTSRLYEEL